MSLPALHSSADIRSITERVNVIIRNIYNLVIPVGAADTVLTSDGTTLATQKRNSSSILLNSLNTVQREEHTSSCVLERSSCITRQYAASSFSFSTRFFRKGSDRY